MFIFGKFQYPFLQVASKDLNFIGINLTGREFVRVEMEQNKIPDG